eukprot:3392293-Rhodomonas_salina.1
MTLIDAIRTFWDEMRTFLDATYTFVLDREPLTCGGAAVDVAHAVGRLGCARDLVGVASGRTDGGGEGQLRVLGALAQYLGIPQNPGPKTLDPRP